jgi:hypothetical protein
MWGRVRHGYEALLPPQGRLLHLEVALRLLQVLVETGLERDSPIASSLPMMSKTFVGSILGANV